jgi:hypothetical protein
VTGHPTHEAAKPYHGLAASPNARQTRQPCAFLVTMAEEVRYKVKVLEDGHITVDAPLSVFSSDKKGYFTLFDNNAASKGKSQYRTVFP